MPVARLLLGLIAATVLMVGTLVVAGPDRLGPWAHLGINLAGLLVVVLFAPAYFGVDRDSHRRR